MRYSKTLIIGACILMVSAFTLMPLGTSMTSREGIPDGLTPGRVVLRFDEGIPADLGALVAKHGGRVAFVNADGIAFASVDVLNGDGPGFIEKVTREPGVAGAELSGIAMALAILPVDEKFKDQWAPPIVNLPQAWLLEEGSHDIDVHVLDTGIDMNHVDLKANACRRGPNYAGTGIGSHGSHVMGIAAAQTMNKEGISGAAQTCVTDVQVLTNGGWGYWEWVAAGMIWSANNGAHIISMSLGGWVAPQFVRDALVYAANKGTLVIAAAGNSGCGADTVIYPAKWPEAIAVSAVAPKDGTKIAGFSSCGPSVFITAPGQGILSTLPGNTYGKLDGTSMATPYVSGITALAYAAAKDLGKPMTAAKARCLLQNTATELGDAGRDSKFGYGRVDAFRMVTAVYGLDPAGAVCGL